MSNVKEQLSQVAVSAKEAAHNVGEQVSDFFQGNPFATPVGKKIELATDSNLLATENWGLNMEICDFINGYEDGPKDAIRALRKRMHTQIGKNNTNIMYTLTVLETCVKNCDHRFHVLVCSKDFIQDLVKLVGPKFDAPQIIQERVLSLIQAWTDAFQNVPDLVGVRQVYDELRSKGVEFPAADLDTLAPIITPKRTVYPEPQQQPAAQAWQDPAADAAAAPPAGRSRQTYQVAPHSEVPLEASAEQLAKLRQDIDVVNCNLKVFREMLTEITPNKVSDDELQLILELNQTCRQMQQRVLELIGQVTNDEVTSELLLVNDEFNGAFEKFERFMANKEKEEPAQQAAAPSDSLIDHPTAASVADQLSGLKMSTAASSSSTAEAYKANAEPQAAVGLRTVVNDKTAAVSDQEAAEMAAWLNMQGKPQEPHDPENDKL
ncbi:unnamed protein product, partial [Mesorhabditis spiculigera]